MRGAVVQSLPQWTVADNAGPEAARVFVLKDGKPLNSGIPGIYTWSGFHQIFQPLLPGVSKDIAEDQWVLGRDKRGGLVAAVGEMNKMRQDVLGLYMNDYTLHWDAMLDNIALRPFASLAEGASELEVLSLPESPLRDLYHAIDDQTQLSRASAADQAAKEAEKKATTAGKRFASFGAYLARAGMSADEAQVATILAEAFGKDSTTGKPIETRVDEHFRDLHQFVVGGADKSSQLEDTISQLRLIKQNMNEAANSPNTGTALSKMLPGGGAGTGGPGATAQLQDLAQSVPKPVGTMLRAVSQNVTQVAANGASQQIADAWSTKVYPVCRDAFNRYPFVASSALDVPPDDFSRVLAPGGMMDQFFDQYLKAYVDKTQKPWRWQAGSQAKLNLQDSSLPQFQYAADIGEALFPSGGTKVSSSFELEREQIDAGLAKVIVEIGGGSGGQRVEFSHGPNEPASFQWPASNGATLVRVTMVSAADGNQKGIEKSGPWALLRLLDDAEHVKVTPSSQPDVIHIAFETPVGAAEFKLTAHSERNLFTLPALHNFRCPAKL